jgi:hypothetical protein
MLDDRIALGTTNAARFGGTAMLVETNRKGCCFPTLPSKATRRRVARKLEIVTVQTRFARNERYEDRRCVRPRLRDDWRRSAEPTLDSRSVPNDVAVGLER